MTEDRSETKRHPSPEDPPGTRYTIDGDGNLIKDRRQDSAARSVLIWTVLGLLTIVTALSIVGFFDQKSQREQSELDTARTLYDIRAGLRENCQTSGNVLRDDVRDEFVDLKGDFLIPLFESVAATIPPSETAHDLLLTAAEELRERKRTIKDRIPNADCQQLYPLLDNPDTEENEVGQ